MGENVTVEVIYCAVVVLSLIPATAMIKSVFKYCVRKTIICNIAPNRC